ncbi:MAG TPA: GNAT family N-acetyltransferase [Gemmatimonadales bacterium]|nr:GNAT family N-acetyltransferase [Gemmatimonadales bacterium]
MSDGIIREMERGEDFAEWFAELVERQGEETGTDLRHEEHHLVLSNEIGDWIGGLRYYIRGGVAHLLELVVTPAERHQGHGHGLVAAFERRAHEAGAHLAEFWTDDLRSEALLAAFGWRRVLERRNYVGHRTWYLMEKVLDSD